MRCTIVLVGGVFSESASWDGWGCCSPDVQRRREPFASPLRVTDEQLTGRDRQTHTHDLQGAQA
jgi:hypothetical protein